MKPTVILRACADYDAERIRRIVGEGLDTLGLKPRGRTLVKPNVVASGELFPHAYTRPEVVEGVLRALRDRAGADLKELAVGERCGITVPTRYSFKEAGYFDMLDRVRAEAYCFEEQKQVEIPLYHAGRLRDSFFTPEPVARADFFVNVPKFKAHPWTTVTFSMKNYIGIQDDRHRLIDHDHKLDEKVADLQYIIQPQLVVIDAITAGEGRMLTPIPFPLGLIIMGDNQVAVDAVCCAIIGVDPDTVAHIRLAADRGFGPTSLGDIRMVGDVSLNEAKERASGFRVGLIRVEDYFKGTHIRAHAGPPPGGSGGDYCWGGCPGAMEEAIEILRVYDAACDEKMPRMHVVFGSYDGPIDAKPGEKIVFMGDCATYHGFAAGRRLDLESLYVDRSEKSVYDASADDIYVKMAKVGWKLWQGRNEDVLRMPGCPVSVAEQALLLIRLARMSNPFLDPSYAFSFSHSYLSWRTRTALKRIFGEPYQQAGPSVRGAARPAQSLPPAGVAAPLEGLRTGSPP